MSWIGPYQFRKLLENAHSRKPPRPGEVGAVYVVTRRRWRSRPSRRSGVLYVGGTTGHSRRFRTRIGDLIADTFGFFCRGTRRHSGGRSLYRWCREHRVNPMDLYIGWRDRAPCKRGAEVEEYERLRPLLNKNRPPRCSKHS